MLNASFTLLILLAGILTTGWLVIAGLDGLANEFEKDPDPSRWGLFFAQCAMVAVAIAYVAVVMIILFEVLP